MKTPILPKLVFNLMQSINMLTSLVFFAAVAIVVVFVEINKLILKFIWEYKGPGLAKTILKKEKA